MSDIKTTQIRLSRNCMDNLKSIASQAKLGSANAVINRLVEALHDEFCEDHKKFFKAAIAMGKDPNDTIIHRSLRMPEDNLTKLQQMAHKASIKNETVIAWIVDYLLYERVRELEQQPHDTVSTRVFMAIESVKFLEHEDPMDSLLKTPGIKEDTFGTEVHMLVPNRVQNSVEHAMLNWSLERKLALGIGFKDVPYSFYEFTAYPNIYRVGEDKNDQ